MCSVLSNAPAFGIKAVSEKRGKNEVSYLNNWEYFIEGTTREKEGEREREREGGGEEKERGGRGRERKNERMRAERREKKI